MDSQMLEKQLGDMSEAEKEKLLEVLSKTHGVRSEFGNGAGEIEKDKYILFRIGDKHYATSLLSVREVIRYQDITTTPNCLPHFKGIINLRGQIVGVIDLRIKFHAPDDRGDETAMLVYDTTVGPIAAVVDSVDQVGRIEETEIKAVPGAVKELDSTYVDGACEVAGNLTTVINLNKILEEMEISQILKHTDQDGQDTSNDQQAGAVDADTQSA